MTVDVVSILMLSEPQESLLLALVISFIALCSTPNIWNELNYHKFYGIMYIEYKRRAYLYPVCTSHGVTVTVRQHKFPTAVILDTA